MGTTAGAHIIFGEKKKPEQLLYKYPKMPIVKHNSSNGSAHLFRARRAEVNPERCDCTFVTPAEADTGTAQHDCGRPGIKLKATQAVHCPVRQVCVCTS